MDNNATDVEIKPGQARSWLDATYGPVKAWQLAEKLITRCKGERVLKIELTYRREEFQSPDDLYYKASAERHLRRFISRLSERLGTSLTGLWIAKTEFQSGGWLHWHILIIGLDRIEHDLLDKCWGWGFVWIRRAGEFELRYFCKYFSKTDGVPPFLYTYRAGSVKIIHASPGFWRSPVRSGGGRPDGPIPIPVYTSIGQMINKASNRSTYRVYGRWFGNLKINFNQLLDTLRHLGLDLVPAGSKGWIAVTIDATTWQYFLGCFRSVFGVVNSVSLSGYPEQMPAAISEAAAGDNSGVKKLYLINNTKPPNPPPNIPIWLERVIEWTLAYRESPA